MVAAVALVMLVGAAAAQADNISAIAGQQFSGVVDSAPSCTDPTSVMIDWGDTSPQSVGAINASGVSGTHTYATKGTFSITIHLVNPSDLNCSDDFSTASVLPPVMFSQCPPVGVNSGCQFLITVTNNGNLVQGDPNQGPYENSEDSLIGVVNNSSSPISHMPLSVPGSELFGFEGDGLCNNGSGPTPSGCAPPPGSAAGTTCGVTGTSSICSFPTPPGQPAGYTEPGAPTGNTQNGYEGPTTWFSNVSADTSRGQVNFSPALQPGQSTYFSLEEPPTSTTIGVGSSPTGGAVSPPKVGTSTASFSGAVNPEGLRPPRSSSTDLTCAISGPEHPGRTTTTRPRRGWLEAISTITCSPRRFRGSCQTRSTTCGWSPERRRHYARS